MYFMLADLMHRFIYLKLGLAVVLVWVGIKMLLLEIYKIPTTFSLAVVIAILAVAVTASWVRTRASAAAADDPGHTVDAATCTASTATGNIDRQEIPDTPATTDRAR